MCLDLWNRIISNGSDALDLPIIIKRTQIIRLWCGVDFV